MNSIKCVKLPDFVVKIYADNHTKYVSLCAINALYYI